MVKELKIGGRYVTISAQAVLTKEEWENALKRHKQCDWGEVNEEQRLKNDKAYEGTGKILSAYTSASGHHFWVQTEDRDKDCLSTNIFLPDEFLSDDRYEKYETRFNYLKTAEMSTELRDLKLARLMAEMERELRIPMLRDEEFENKNKEIIRLYKEIANGRSL